MSEPHHYTFTLQIPKQAFIRIHSHRFADNLEGASQEMLDQLFEKLPDPVSHPFGGRWGTQFKTPDDVASFLNTCKVVFDKWKIDSKHLHPLLYIFCFLEEDDEQQSHDMNRFNRLLDSSRFLLDFIVGCSAHVKMMANNETYAQVYDQYTDERFFAKKELVETMDHEDLIVYCPPEDRANDIVKYIKISFEDRYVSVPHDMIVNISSDRVLRNFEGAVVPKIDLPPRFVRETLNFIIGEMVKDHKENDTEFYRELTSGTPDEYKLKKIYKQYRKRALSYNRALTKVAIMISDYLKENKLLSTKADISKFLFEFFALLQVLRLKNNETLPSDYSQLIPFYAKRGVSGETIRLMMRDVGEI